MLFRTYIEVYPQHFDLLLSSCNPFPTWRIRTPTSCQYQLAALPALGSFPLCRWRRVRSYNVGWCLNKLDENALAAPRFCGAPLQRRYKGGQRRELMANNQEHAACRQQSNLGMEKDDIVTRRALPDSARRKAHAVDLKEFHRLLEVVDPESDVVQSGHVHLHPMDGERM